MIDYVRYSKAHIFVDSLIEQIIIGEDEIDFHHLARVLRLQPGQHVTAAHNGYIREYNIDKVTREEILLSEIRECEEMVDDKKVDLGVSLFKLDRLEWGIRKAIEVGVASITIGKSERSLQLFTESQQKKFHARIETIVRQASMQSRRSYLAPVTFVDSIIDYCCTFDGNVVVCDPDGTEQRLCDGLIVIGPEGGFTSSEKVVLAEKGSFWNVSPYILRAETAMAVAPAMYRIY